MEGNINLYTFIIVKPLSEKKQYKHILMIHLYIICKLSCTGNYSSDVRFHPHSCPLVLPKSESCIKSFATGELYTETKISLVIRRIYSYTPCRDTAFSHRGGISLSSTHLLRLRQCYPTLPKYFL